mgnify:CR=1 FL=1|jgi:hypothetical protein
MVKFKNIPYWLKGGIIALGLSLIVRFLLEFGFFERLYFGWILYYIPSLIFHPNGNIPFMMDLSGYFFWTIIGIIVGLIVGKIKSSKKK